KVQVTDNNNPAAIPDVRTYTLTVSRKPGAFGGPVSFTSSSSTSGNGTATVGGDMMNPTVSFRITGTATGTVTTAAIPAVRYAISPNSRVAVIVTPTTGELILYNLGIVDPTGQAPIGSRIGSL